MAEIDPKTLNQNHRDENSCPQSGGHEGSRSPPPQEQPMTTPEVSHAHRGCSISVGRLAAARRQTLDDGGRFSCDCRNDEIRRRQPAAQPPQPGRC